MRYHLRHLERYKLGMAYPEIVSHVKALLQVPQLKGRAVCVVDGTGVGRAVVDLLRQEQIRPLVPVSIHGGEAVSHEGGYWRVPKRDLAGVLQVLLQARRLQIAQGLPYADVLTREMEQFRVKINLQTGHDSYEAWRERDHDDLVLALALACWFGEHGHDEASLVPWASGGAGRVPHQPTGGDLPRGWRP